MILEKNFFETPPNGLLVNFCLAVFMSSLNTWTKIIPRGNQ